eukprot:3215665-Pleurochrysis_carterae.AAC.2
MQPSYPPTADAALIPANCGCSPHTRQLRLSGGACASPPLGASPELTQEHTYSFISGARTMRGCHLDAGVL